jgi:hypothetical protein
MNCSRAEKQGLGGLTIRCQYVTLTELLCSLYQLRGVQSFTRSIRGIVMEWILPIIFGGAGGAMSHYWSDDDGWGRNPPGCIMCALVAGAAVAIIIEMLVRQQFGEAGFFEHAALNLASGLAGNALIGGAFGMFRAKGVATR